MKYTSSHNNWLVFCSVIDTPLCYSVQDTTDLNICCDYYFGYLASDLVTVLGCGGLSCLALGLNYSKCYMENCCVLTIALTLAPFAVLNILLIMSLFP